MNLSINAEHFLHKRCSENKRSIYECIDIAHAAGFRVIDLNAREASPYEIAKLSDYIGGKGMRVNQSHLPFNRYKKENFEDFSKALKKCAENARGFGSKILVIHGDEFDFKTKEFSREAAIEFNYELFAPIAEYAEKHDMKIAFENVFEDNFDGHPRFCSITEDLIDLCDRFQSENVGICWDFGHGRVQYEKGEGYLNELPKLGDRLIATHVHDNYYGNDIHCFPFLGMMRWEECMQILKDLNYKGDFTFKFVYDRIPDELLVDYMKLIYKTGEYLINL